MISLDYIDQRERKKQQGQDATFYSSCCQQAQSLGAPLRDEHTSDFGEHR